MEPRGFKLMRTTIIPAKEVSTALTIVPPIVELWPDFSPKRRGLLVSIGVSSEQKPVLVYTKKLFNTDVDIFQNRLTFPKKGINAKFLSFAEETRLWRKEKLDVKVIDPSMEVRKMSLSHWKKGTNMQKGEVYDPNFVQYSYSLIRNWMELANSNGIVLGDSVEIWSFRYNIDSLGLIIRRFKRLPLLLRRVMVAVLVLLLLKLVGGKKRKRGSNSPSME